MIDMISQDILVPTDFGPGSRLALERAIRSLGPEGGNICVLHVLDQHLIDQTRTLLPEIGETELRARLRQQAEVHYAQLVAGTTPQERGNYPAFMRHAYRSSLRGTSTGAHLGFRCAKDHP